MSRSYIRVNIRVDGPFTADSIGFADPKPKVLESGLSALAEELQALSGGGPA